MSLRYAPRALESTAPSHGSSQNVQLRRALQAMPAKDREAALVPPRPVQYLQYRGHGDDGANAHALAAQGIAGGGGALPHAETIQKSFGRHDIGHVQAHTGGAAKQASQALGAEAYASGHDVAFASTTPSLHTAAHEAAHVVQQKAGVSLKGGIGESGDKYEQHADAVADAVVQGKSAEGLLDQMSGAGSENGSVQRRAIQREATETVTTARGTSSSTDQVTSSGSLESDPAGTSSKTEADETSEPPSKDKDQPQADVGLGKTPAPSSDTGPARTASGGSAWPDNLSLEATLLKVGPFSGVLKYGKDGLSGGAKLGFDLRDAPPQPILPSLLYFSVPCEAELEALFSRSRQDETFKAALSATLKATPKLEGGFIFPAGDVTGLQAKAVIFGAIEGSIATGADLVYDPRAKGQSGLSIRNFNATLGGKLSIGIEVAVRFKPKWLPEGWSALEAGRKLEWNPGGNLEFLKYTPDGGVQPGQTFRDIGNKIDEIKKAFGDAHGDTLWYRYEDLGAPMLRTRYFKENASKFGFQPQYAWMRKFILDEVSDENNNQARFLALFDEDVVDGWVSDDFCKDPTVATNHHIKERVRAKYGSEYADFGPGVNDRIAAGVKRQGEADAKAQRDAAFEEQRATERSALAHRALEVLKVDAMGIPITSLAELGMNGATHRLVSVNTVPTALLSYFEEQAEVFEGHFAVKSDVTDEDFLRVVLGLHSDSFDEPISSIYRIIILQDAAAVTKHLEKVATIKRTQRLKPPVPEAWLKPATMPAFDGEAVLAKSRHKTFMLVDHSTPGWGLLGTAEATLEGDRSVTITVPDYRASVQAETERNAMEHGRSKDIPHAKYAPGSSLVVPFTFEVLPKKG